MITADQLVAHLVGDYLLQSDWMANEKTRHLWVAIIHATTYTVPFVFLGASLSALLVILFTHAVIDRYRLARYVVFAKNRLAPPYYQVMDAKTGQFVTRYPTWKECEGTGYLNTRPAWMAVWLMIIADNIIHVLINGAAIKWL